MELLPPELVIKILSFLDPKSIIICRQVCLRWRILTTTKLANPLYLPSVIRQIMQYLQGGNLRDLVKLRLVCKLWKSGLDKLTYNQAIYLNGVTSLDSRSVNSLPHNQWNPFPSRIVRMKLCHGHDNPETSENPLANLEQDLFMDHFGEHIHYLQVSLEHATCAETHFVKILNYSKSVKGLVISETPSPFRFVKNDTLPSSSDVPFTGCDLMVLENLNFLKLDDSDSKLKYIELYKKLIKNAPNLQHLELNGYHHLDMGIVRLLSDPQVKLLNLTKLKMDAEDPYLMETLEILNKSKFPLKYLSLKINGFGDKLACHNCTELLHTFLKGVGGTLQRLELKLSWYDKDNDDNDKYLPELLSSFPSSTYLNMLERFKLVGYRGSLDFLMEFPLLKYLMLVNYDLKGGHGYQNKEPFHSQIPTLKQVHFLSQQEFQSESAQFKKRASNFMYEGDPSFISKYCGLCQEGFP